MPGENRVGSDASAQVRLPENRAPAALGTLTLSGREATVRASGEVRRLTPGREDEPVILRHGSLTLSLIRRGERLAVRVRDSQSEARRHFAPIESFPIDPAWRFEARFEPYDPPRRIPVPNILGSVDEEVSPGAVAFDDADGRTHRLDPILERGETNGWIIFGDATNGRETYGGGRFVYVPPAVNGRMVLDFNKAYNPPCVFTPHATCPLPPLQNRMTIRVEAGELAYRGSRR